MNITKIIIWIFACTLSCHGQNQVGKAMVTLNVVDQNERPVVGAEVYGAFEYSDYDGDSFKGFTDTNGCITVSGQLMSIFNGYVRKEGYYETAEIFWWWRRFPEAKIADGKWQPWNPTLKVVLKKQNNPIPLLVRNLNLEVPQLDIPYGLDLEKGDWVAPYGAGIITDIIVRAKGHRSQTDFYDWSFGLDLSFPNEHDGIQKFTYPMNGNNAMGSRLKSAQQAPEDGYEADWSCLKISKKSDTQELLGIGYYLRTRTKYDESKKQIISAVYSKVYGRIFGGMRHNNQPPFGGTPYISFTYYMNPDLNDRNLEYDMKKNLAIPVGAPPKVRNDSVYFVNQP